LTAQVVLQELQELTERQVLQEPQDLDLIG